MSASSPLITHLLALPATGHNGFEGLARDLLQSIMGGTWRLQKSGRQDGADIVHENGEMVAEAKRYGSRLPLDELKAKLKDAIGSRPDLILWILVTTRGLSGDDSRALVAEGEKEGVTVVVIDHSASPAGPSRLEALCASAPHVVRAHGPLSPAAEACLKTVTAEADAKQALCRDLAESEMGFAAARRATAAHLCMAMAKKEEARHHLRSPADLLAQRRAPRPAIWRALSDWWQSGAPQAAVLLGEEGLGKTWAALGWWLDAWEDDAEALPPTLVVPAQGLPPGELGDVLGDALHKATGRRRPQAFWARRAARWVKGGEGPRLLLVLDGINQAWSEPSSRWHALLREARAEPWAGRVAVLMTCRPDHWKAELGGMSALEPVPRVIAVAPFTPEERDTLLRRLDQDPTAFDSRVLELMRVPRLCLLAMTHAEELAQSGDVTRERLTAIDWRERLKIHGENLVTLEEFEDFAVTLGRSVRDALEKGDSFSITRSELVAELGRESDKGKQDLLGTLSEIIDGRWLRKESTHRFMVSPELTPFVLGLALVRHMDGLPGEEAMHARLADFMDPLNGQDFAADILAAAVTVALHDGNMVQTTVDVLLDAWVLGRNFGVDGVETWWRLSAGTPTPFLDQAERWWRRREGGHQFDDLFVKGLANAAERSEFAKASVVDRVLVWLSQLWEDPYQGEFLGKVEDGETPARRKAIGEAFAAYKALRTQHPFLPDLYLNAEEDGWAWLSYRAFAIISLLPRGAFVPAVVAWAMARAVAGSARYSGCRTRANWVLRLNPEDAAEARRALDTAIGVLREVGDPVCLDAADLLLGCAGAAPPSLTEPATRNWQNTVRLDAASGRVEWDDTTALTWGRCERMPFDATMGLARHAIDPTASLSNAAVNRVRALARAVVPSVEGDGSDARGLENARLALARWAPDALADYLRRRLMLLRKADVTGRTGLLNDIASLASILDQESAEAVRGMVPEPDMPKHWTDLPVIALLLLDLHGRSANDQIVRLDRQAPNRPAVKAISFLLTPLKAPDFEILAKHLDPADPPNDLKWWLEYLEAAGLNSLPASYEPVATLLKHEALEVRTAAMNVAWANSALRQHVADSDWRADQTVDAREAVAGSGVLLEATQADMPTAFADRLSPDALSVLVANYAESDDVLDLYSASLADRLTELLSTRSRQLGIPRFIETEGARTFARRRPEEAVSLLERFATGSASRMFWPGWPVEGLCLGLLEVCPDIAAKHWRAEVATMRDAQISSSGWHVLPFLAPDSPAVTALRAEQLSPSVARTDEDLAQVSLACEEAGNRNWLIAHIRADLRDAIIWRRARGLALAAFLDQSDAADCLWAEIEAAAPTSSWLENVQAWAIGAYRRNVWARRWMREWIIAPDEETAFSRHALLVACLDQRGKLWLRDMLKEAQPTLGRPRLMQWDAMAERVRMAINDGWKPHKNTLFGDKVESKPFWPWL